MKARLRLARRLRVESLEVRTLMHGDPLHPEDVEGDPGLPQGFVPADIGTPTAGDGASAATHPLTSVPILNSLVGAAVSVYLDFVGHFDAVWGSYQNITTPVYNTDGDASTFSDLELTSIFDIWQGVSEDYAPFNVNVTTVAPPNFNNGSAVLVAIGGNGSWLGDLAGGVAYVDSFTNSLSNTVFVFPDNLGNGQAKYVADAASHEAGHAFGLQHQSKWSGSTKVAEYYAGPGNGTAPLMGDSYFAARSLWWNGTSSVSKSTIQDDMGVISRAANGFGYRADDYGNTAATASQLSVANNQFSASGIITAISDVDYFSFETGSGQISLSVNVGAYTNLDATLELRTDTGVLITSVNTTNSFGATITTTVGAGIYRLVVASGGGYGNVGQYTVSGTLQTPSTAVIAPINLTSNTSGGHANLSWVDKAYNENSYFVDRSDDGLSWNSVATLGANATSWSDSNVTAGATYYYRVWAAGDVENSSYSNIRTVTMPPSNPTGLAANAVSSSILNLTWNDVSGEAGFLIQRSTNGGSTWTQIATVGAGVTSYQNTGLKANTAYAYRVIATNSGGASAFSNVANGTTLPIPPAPLAGSGLAAHAVSTSQIDLSWTDNASNESGYIVQRAIGSGSFKQIAALGADATTFSDTTATANKTFKYRVRAFNDGGNSAYSNTGSATTPVVIAPSALIGTVVSSAKVDLTWTDNGSTELGFRIERYSGSSWKQIAQVGPDVTTFSDTTVAANKSYKYRVHAFDAGGNSVLTNTVSLKTPVVIAPSTLAGTPNGATEVDVAWLDNGSDEAGFRIERATGSGSWKQIAEVGVDVTSFSDTTVVANKSYKYRVRAFNTAGTSAYTNTVTIKTPIASSVPSASLASPTPSSTPASSTHASSAVFGSHGPIPGSIVGVPRGAVLSSQASLSLDELVHAVFADDDWIKHLLSPSG